MKRHILRFACLAAMLAPAAVVAAPTVELVSVQGGCFQMGDTAGDGMADERPVHKVCLKDFSMGKYEVTQAQWREVMGNGPANFAGDRNPVEQVSWHDVQQFIARLSQQAGIAYRLPTEAEWEYAARGGAKQEKWAGTSDEKQLPELAWFERNAMEKSHEVGGKKPNALGIHDMTGNVAEWCQDSYADAYYGMKSSDNPVGPPAGSHRVVRGGSWVDDGWSSRAARRGARLSETKTSYLGFRLAVSGR
jgi:sulfatase modifying factor 1